MADEQNENDNLGRLTSETSIGFPETPSSDSLLKEPPGHRLSANVESEGHHIPSDVFCLVVHCNEHKRIALQCQPNKSYFLPCVQERFDDVSIDEVLRDLLKTITTIPQSMYDIFLVYKLIFHCLTLQEWLYCQNLSMFVVFNC